MYKPLNRGHVELGHQKSACSSQKGHKCYILIGIRRLGSLLGLAKDTLKLKYKSRMEDHSASKEDNERQNQDRKYYNVQSQAKIRNYIIARVF